MKANRCRRFGSGVVIAVWWRATLVLSEADLAFLRITLEEGNGVQSAGRTDIVLDRASGEIITARSGASGTPGARLRGWFRFVHTGEIYGVAGKTIARLASRAAAILVCTGLSPGLRRLARIWLWRRAAARA